MGHSQPLHLGALDELWSLQLLLGLWVSLPGAQAGGSQQQTLPTPECMSTEGPVMRPRGLGALVQQDPPAHQLTAKPLFSFIQASGERANSKTWFSPSCYF